MMAMTAWIGRYAGEVTFDATSPIKDAVEGTLYVAEPGYLKFKTDKLASYYMKHPQQRWTCDCTYCKKYGQTYKMDYARAARWFAHHPDRGESLEKADLRAGELAEALPLFSMPRGGEQAAHINDWRMGHNHMMLMRIMADLRNADGEKALKALITEKLDAYTENALPHYAYAIEEAWALS
jgi:queuine/archaeosine tRNA-ribosyltransferase